MQRLFIYFMNSFHNYLTAEKYRQLLFMKLGIVGIIAHPLMEILSSHYGYNNARSQQSSEGLQRSSTGLFWTNHK